MFRLTLILIVIISANAGHLHKFKMKRKMSDKIVGGYETMIENRPYQVSLNLIDYRGNSYKCGGSILNARYILTASHCLSDIVKAEVRVGSTNYGSGGNVYRSEKIIMHPFFNPQTFDYDVGIIDLDDYVIKFDDRTTKAVDLIASRIDLPAGTRVIVSGWGATYQDGPSTDVLREVTLSTLSKKNCSDRYRRFTSRMICAGDLDGGKDSCQGDSGGPLVLAKNNTQVGIVSFGYGCAQPDNPGYYAAVSKYRRWIKIIAGV